MMILLAPQILVRAHLPPLAMLSLAVRLGTGWRLFTSINDGDAAMATTAQARTNLHRALCAKYHDDFIFVFTAASCLESTMPLPNSVPVLRNILPAYVPVWQC